MTRSTSEAARQLAKQRRQVTVRCAHCGNETTGISTRRYCSDACRVAAARADRQQLEAEVAAAMGRLEALSARISARVPGGAFTDTGADLINEAREERDTELWGPA